MNGFLRRNKEMLLIVATGAAVGVLGVCLACLGNPRNSGICVSCFMENLAGSLGLHANGRMQYIRPELTGFVLGGAASALLAREFRPEGGSSPMLRFMAGILLIVGCSVFLGCPVKMVLRLTGGDFTALAGAGGLVFGIWLGYAFLRRGFYLGDARPAPYLNGLMIPLLMAGLLLAAFFQPGFLYSSATGPGAMRAAQPFALGSGLLIGFLAQRSRFCVTGSIGNFIVSGDRKLLWGLLSMVAAALAVSMYNGLFTPGFEGQPGAHLAYGWSFLGMALVGLVSIMIGGCPFRQLILASQGSSDAGAAVLGMVAGGGIVQSWGITSSSSGPTQVGEVVTLAGLALAIALGAAMRVRD